MTDPAAASSNSAPVIALVADGSQAANLAEQVTGYQDILAKYHLRATSNLVAFLRQELGAAQAMSACGELSAGGDLEIAADILAGNVVAVIALANYGTNPQQPLLSSLVRACHLSDIPLALTAATVLPVLSNLRSIRVAHLIFNPVSGQGNPQEDLLRIRQWLTPQFQLHVHLTTPDCSPKTLAEAAIAAGADLLIASGGDGTVSAVAGAVMGTDIPLGIIPRGTANAFAVALGIPTNLRGACDTIVAGLIQTVDAARCNGLPMILLAGVGFEAETVERANRETKSRWGTLAYILAGFQQLKEQQLFDATLEVDGTTSEFQAAAITVANAAPPTSVLAQGSGQVIASDGLLDITIGSPQNTLQAIDTAVRLFGSALIRTEMELEGVVQLQATTIRVTTDPPQKVVVDGEIIGTTPIEVECLPQSLQVLAPPQTG
ncbi:MAG: YegS/Rv2252/BmrU family lipid kinase [Leptolyngbya sp. RL_3_1]|nr:YegS/Rv2252/BmrU family lipid kinase [Leptolyngbya sp. RL_3_1]